MRKALQYAVVAIIAAFLFVAFLMLAMGTGWIDLAKAVISVAVAATVAMYGFKHKLLPE